jgi:hypothetical protein
MTEKNGYFGLVKWQTVMTWLIIGCFGISLLAHLIDRGLGHIFYAASIILLMLFGPIRLLWISFYFRKNADRKYHYFAVIVLLIIVLTTLMKIWQ